jgi:hypothetical protein
MMVLLQQLQAMQTLRCILQTPLRTMQQQQQQQQQTLLLLASGTQQSRLCHLPMLSCASAASLGHLPLRQMQQQPEQQRQRRQPPPQMLQLLPLRPIWLRRSTAAGEACHAAVAVLFLFLCLLLPSCCDGIGSVRLVACQAQHHCCMLRLHWGPHR